MTKDEAILIFNIQPFFTEDELRERWRFLVKHHHPDLGYNQEFFKKLLDAYHTLKAYREKYSAKQEWFDFVSQENRREVYRVRITEDEEDASIISYLYPLLAVPVIVGTPYAASNEQCLQQLFYLQLKFSAATGKLLYILSQKPANPL